MIKSPTLIPEQPNSSTLSTPNPKPGPLQSEQSFSPKPKPATGQAAESLSTPPLMLQLPQSAKKNFRARTGNTGMRKVQERVRDHVQVRTYWHMCGVKVRISGGWRSFASLKPCRLHADLEAERGLGLGRISWLLLCS